MKRFSQNQIRSIVAGVTDDRKDLSKISVRKAGSDIFHSYTVVDDSNLKGSNSLLDIQSKNSLNNIIESPANSQIHECTMCSSLKKANDDLNQQMFQISTERQQMINYNIETQQLIQQKDEKIFQLNLKLHGLENIHHKCVELQEVNQKLIDESKQIQGLNQVYRETITKLTEEKMKLAQKASTAESLQKELGYEKDIRQELDKEVIKAKAELYEMANKYEQAKDQIKALAMKIQELQQQIHQKDQILKDYKQIKYQNQCLQLQKQGDRIRLDQQNDIILRLKGMEIQKVNNQMQTSPLLQNQNNELSAESLENHENYSKIPEKTITTQGADVEKSEEAQESEDKSEYNESQVTTIFAVRQSIDKDDGNAIDLQQNLVQSYPMPENIEKKQNMQENYIPKQFTESQNQKFNQIMANSNYKTLSDSIDENPQSLSSVLANCDKVIAEKTQHDQKNKEQSDEQIIDMGLSMQQESSTSIHQALLINKQHISVDKSLENSKINQNIIKSDTATHTSDSIEQKDQLSIQSYQSSVSIQHDDVKQTNPTE